MNENNVDLETAIGLLKDAYSYIARTHGDDCDLYYEIQDFLKQFN